MYMTPDAPRGRYDVYKGTSLIRKHPLRRTTIRPWAKGYCRVLEGSVFL
jgi:hypothetical protein